jgi:hypothetical protein
MTLVAHGNAFLQKDYDISDYYPNNGAFVFSNKVVFVELKPNTSELPIVANNPTEWLKNLKNGKCKYLRLFHASSEGTELEGSITNDRMLAGRLVVEDIGGLKQSMPTIVTSGYGRRKLLTETHLIIKFGLFLILQV